jgi:hypothetical protein
MNSPSVIAPNTIWCLIALLLEDLGTHHDDDHIRIEPLDLYQRLNPTYTGMPDIKEHQIRRGATHGLNRSFRRWKGFNMICFFECDRYYIPCGLCIINHVQI